MVAKLVQKKRKREQAIGARGRSSNLADHISIVPSPIFVANSSLDTDILQRYAIICE